METEDIAEVVESAAEAEAVVDPGAQASGASEAPLAPMTKEELEQRFVGQMNAMLDEADQRRMLPVFANVVSWKLAVLAHRCGPYVTGDVLRYLGHHLAVLAERDAAQREADNAKRKGQRPH